MLGLVSCITPTFGRSNLLQEMYWCWNNQAYPEKELIIVNDEANLTITTSDPRVKIFNIPERFIGLGAKRNFCIEQVSPQAKYICPFDDDDLFFHDHIQSLVIGFLDNPSVDRIRNRRHFIAKNNLFDRLIEETWPFFGASCFKADVLKSLKFKDTYICGEDADLIESNKLTTHYITLKYPTFIYRTGMGVVHASGNRTDPNDPIAQKKIHDRIGDSVQKLNEPKELVLEGKLSTESDLLYKDLLVKRLYC